MATEAQIQVQNVIAQDLAVIFPSMSEEKITRYASAIERATNYPTFGDGMTRPVAVSNVAQYIDENGNQRTVINLAVKTEKSYGKSRAGERKMPMPNANISFPTEWGVKWRGGDYVCAFIEDGEIKKLYPATTMQAREITVSKKSVGATKAIAEHGDETLEIDPTTGEAKPLTKKQQTVLAKATVPVDAEADDLPF